MNILQQNLLHLNPVRTWLVIAQILIQHGRALDPIFPQPTIFHESMMSKKSQTVKSSQTRFLNAIIP